jgi:hypothetical protein
LPAAAQGRTALPVHWSEESLTAEPSIRSVISAWLEARQDVQSFTVTEALDGQLIFEVTPVSPEDPFILRINRDDPRS